MHVHLGWWGIVPRTRRLVPHNMEGQMASRYPRPARYRRNPKGSITMNNLELGGIILKRLVLEGITYDFIFKRIGVFYDKILVVAWKTKLHTSNSILTSCLLWLLGIHIHVSGALSLKILKIISNDNDMSGMLSRSFKRGKYFTANQSLIYLFDNTFSLPHNTSWIEYQLLPNIISWVMSCMST